MQYELINVASWSSSISRSPNLALLLRWLAGCCVGWQVVALAGRLFKLAVVLGKKLYWMNFFVIKGS